jgi:hypothetical protein
LPSGSKGDCPILPEIKRPDLKTLALAPLLAAALIACGSGTGPDDAAVAGTTPPPVRFDADPLAPGPGTVAVSANSPMPGVAGARAIRGEVPVRNRFPRIVPSPERVLGDKGRLHSDGCLAGGDAVRSESCTYGNASSPRSVVILGDSRALQFFPAIEPAASRQGWRTVGLVRGNCTVADVTLDPACDHWRVNTMQRILGVEKPNLVVVGTSTWDRYRVTAGGRKLNRAQSQRHLVAGMTRTLRRLRRSGANVVMMRDQSTAPFGPAGCVRQNRTNLRGCAFRPQGRYRRAFELRAARNAGVKAVDTQGHICRPKICPMVIGSAFVYRDRYHLSATFVQTLAPWLLRRLPGLRP